MVISSLQVIGVQILGFAALLFLAHHSRPLSAFFAKANSALLSAWFKFDQKLLLMEQLFTLEIEDIMAKGKTFKRMHFVPDSHQFLVFIDKRTKQVIKKPVAEIIYLQNASKSAFVSRKNASEFYVKQADHGIVEEISMFGHKLAIDREEVISSAVRKIQLRMAEQDVLKEFEPKAARMFGTLRILSFANKKEVVAN